MKKILNITACTQLFLIILFSANISFSQADILFIKADLPSSQLSLLNDLRSLGYSVDTISPAFVISSVLNSHRLAVLNGGINNYPCTNANMRRALVDYSLSGGKLFIEGGQVAYHSVYDPGYVSFSNKALRITNWIAHNGGNLIINENFHHSYFSSYPNVLDSIIYLNYTGPETQDAALANEYCDAVFTNQNYPSHVGLLAFPSVNYPYTIFLTVNYSSLYPYNSARALLQNCIFHLIGSPIGIIKISSSIPEQFGLYQNYPNPFNPETLIRYRLPAAGRLTVNCNVSLKIFDVLGKEIAVLVNENQKPGTYEAEWNALNFPSGVYYYKLTTGEYSEVKKMILLK